MTNKPDITEVATGVFGYIQSEGSWCVNNAGIVVSDNEALLIDTAATVARTQKLRESVVYVSGLIPSAVINTHSHGDHTFGNYLFKEAMIIGHQRTRREVDEAGLHLTTVWPEVEWGRIEIQAPSVTYESRMNVHVGSIGLELFHPGPAHSSNDTIIWLPKEEVAFTGDIVMGGVTPFCPLGSITGTLSAIDKIRDLKPKTLIGGHGKITDVESLNTTERYMRCVQKWAAEGKRSGMSPLEVANAVDLGEFGELQEPERLVANLHCAYAEITHSEEFTKDKGVGEVFMSEVIREMIAYKGGPLTSYA